MSLLTPGRARNPWRILAIALVLDALLLAFEYARQRLALGKVGDVNILRMVNVGLRGLAVSAFLVFAWHEILFLFFRPTQAMGTGLSRVWAVARTTVLEAWASRIWLLPLIWLICALTMICAVVPFDESERIPLYIRTLLTSQQILVMVMMWVMACVSLPREREKKTLISTASKPLSRLEILLGKFTGFAVATGLVMLLMYAASLVILQVSNARLRGRAEEAYQIQKRDFNTTLVTPSEGLKQLSVDGALHAYNYIKVPKTGMNMGVLAFNREDKSAPPARFFIGGTQEKAIYHFSPRLEIPEILLTAPVGRRPYFGFNYQIVPKGAMPDKVQIRVSAYGTGPFAPLEAVINLNRSGEGFWEPDQPDQLFSPFNGKLELQQDRGLVTVEVTCLTPGVMLGVEEGAERDPVTGEVPPNTVTNVEFNNRLSMFVPGAPEQVSLPDAHPLVRGFERRDRQEVSASMDRNADREQAIYRFSGASLRNVPVVNGHFDLSMQLETYKSENPKDPTFAGIWVHSLDNTGGDYEFRQEVLEKRVMTVQVPEKCLGDKDPNRRGDMVVMVFCDTPGHAVTLVEDSVRIELPQTPFFVNLLKSELIIYMEGLLLIGIAITCSVRVGWPVAMFLSGVCAAFGILVEFIAALPDYGGLGALNYRASPNPDAMYKFFDTAASGLWHVLGFISSIVPNFTLFDPGAYIGTLQNTPWSVVGGNALTTLTYMLPFLALSYLLFRKQELG